MKFEEVLPLARDEGKKIRRKAWTNKCMRFCRWADGGLRWNYDGEAAAITNQH